MRRDRPMQTSKLVLVKNYVQEFFIKRSQCNQISSSYTCRLLVFAAYTEILTYRMRDFILREALFHSSAELDVTVQKSK